MFHKFTQTLVLILFCLLTYNVNAQSQKTTGYDTVWIPITSEQIQSQVRIEAKSMVGLYQLSRRASYQSKGLIFYKALLSMEKEQPKNAILAAMHRAAIEESILYGDTSVTKQINMAEYRSDIRRERLEAAKKLNPKLWLNYLTESKLLAWEYTNNNSLEVIEKQINLTQHAIDLAPTVSFPYKQMGGHLSNMVRYFGGSDAKAVLYYNKAEKLAPADCAASLGLAYHYQYVNPNAAGRQKAIQAVYATIPPNVKLTLPLRKKLLDAGIPIPKNR